MVTLPSLRKDGKNYGIVLTAKLTAMTIVIPFDKICLNRCTDQGLLLLMDIALGCEDYEKAIIIRDETNRRLTHQT